MTDRYVFGPETSSGMLFGLAWRQLPALAARRQVRVILAQRSAATTASVYASYAEARRPAATPTRKARPRPAASRWLRRWMRNPAGEHATSNTAITATATRSPLTLVALTSAPLPPNAHSDFATTASTR